MNGPITSDLFGSVPHGFSTRQGASAEDVLPGAAQAMVKQVHSADVIVAKGAIAERDGPEADALVTERPGIALAIVTADCAPVLFVDEEAGVIGAAHAGWRGAKAGVIENTVAAMARFGAKPDRIHAAIGPCIHQANYEVDEPFRAEFEACDERFFMPGRDGHFQFDLPGYVASRLAGAGVVHIDTLPHDTYADPAHFHSFRRATHLKQPTEGRQVSLIALRQTP